MNGQTGRRTEFARSATEDIGGRVWAHFWVALLLAKGEGGYTTGKRSIGSDCHKELQQSFPQNP